MKKVTLVDYGLGNILSVTRALEHCGAEVLLATEPQQILSADWLVLPGVGAFADGMQGLKALHFIEPLTEFSKKERPMLGICLGMQMLMEEAEEFGHHIGLGLIKGKVSLIPPTTARGGPHKIPHIGWNSLFSSVQATPWKGTVLHNTKVGDSVYFVHSFAACPADEKSRLADCDYNGRTISAVVHNGGSIFGTQFHPEKSGTVGIAILSAFLSL
jgi:glutamine amidotransferase